MSSECGFDFCMTQDTHGIDILPNISVTKKTESYVWIAEFGQIYFRVSFDMNLNTTADNVIINFAL